MRLAPSGSDLLTVRARLGAAIVLWLAVFSLSCQVSTFLPASGDVGGRSVLLNILGRTRVMMSGELFLVADSYFHRGQRAAKPTPWDNTFLKRASTALHPTQHMHLSGDHIKEMMPWLWFSLKADPSNVDAHLTVAFWLSRALGHTEEAEDVLRLAQINNPGAISIYAERGRNYLRDGQWDKAWHMFDAGIAVSEASPGPMDSDAQFDKAELLLYRALIDEEKGRLEAARAGYQAILLMFPGRPGVQFRLAHLGEREGAAAAGYMLTSVLKKHDEGKENHHDEHGGDDAHSHGDEHGDEVHDSDHD